MNDDGNGFTVTYQGNTEKANLTGSGRFVKRILMFQKEHGLAVDGFIGEKTIPKLDEYMK